MRLTPHANDNRAPFWDATAITLAAFFALAIPAAAAVLGACFRTLGWL